MNQAEITSDGFRDQMLNSNITSIRDSIGDISTQLCNGFSNVQMSAMQNAFGLQNAINAGFNGTQAQLAQCLKKISRKAKEIFGFTKFEAVGTLA